MKKTHIVIGILVVVTVAHLFVVKYYQHKRTESTLEGQVPSNVAIEERIAKQVSSLETLSEIETLQHLSKMEYYDWPGAKVGAGTIFLHDVDGGIAAESLYERNRIELERILSNRVFRKTLQDLSKLPKNRASALLASELDAALSKYLELYTGFFESQSLDFTIGESADGQPVLLGLRNKLFTLILIAGSLELTNTYENIKKIDVIAKGQEMEVRRIEAPHVRRNYLLLALLHNNLVLASGLYGTSSRKGDVELKPFVTRFSDHKLVDFSAPATEYDDLVRHGVQRLTPDKGYINVRYFDQVTNEDLNELRRILYSP